MPSRGEGAGAGTRPLRPCRLLLPGSRAGLQAPHRGPLRLPLLWQLQGSWPEEVLLLCFAEGARGLVVRSWL